MKKIAGYLVIIMFIVAVIVMTYFNIGINYITILAAVFIIGIFVLLFEMKSIDSRKMAGIAALAALGAASRVPFAAIPGFQPTTFITAVSGYVLGPVNGFMVGSMAAFISNFFLGQGPWTLWQMLGWGICGVFFGFLGMIKKRVSRIPFTVICGIWGYIYGIMLDMWYIIAFVKPIVFKTVLAGFAASFYFDTLHAVGNILFSAIFAEKFIKILSRYNKRYDVEYID
jgi:energy-coupling factor transport system substrate-specific component